MITEKILGQSTILSASNSTVYTVPASTKGIIKILWITNTTVNDVTVKLWVGPAAGDANKLMDTFTIPANDFKQITTYITLSAAETVQLKGGVNLALSVSLFGAEIT